MMSVKKIICPTDFSEHSYEAVKAANQLALLFGAELILVHVVKPIVLPAFSSPGVDSYGSSYLTDAVDEADKKMEEIVRKEISEQVKRRMVIHCGIPAEEIVSIASVEQADVIVIGTHGLTGWRHLVFGSTAEKVVQHASCVVVTIPVPKRHRAQAKQVA